MLKPIFAATALSSFILLSGCSFDQSNEEKKEPKEEQPSSQNSKTETDKNNDSKETPQRQVEVDETSEPAQAGLQTLANPESIPVLVNKQYSLPEDYKPNDLIYPKVDFIFQDKIEKRMMRKEAGVALEEMFQAAESENMHFAGVSAYRSHQTQIAVFNNYVAKDGEEKAKTYSAMPGTSEHETGLAIDVTTHDGACAAQDCFGDTNEAAWLAEHAHEYGFIIRYPEGKENITGYKYEPWHIRYVGVDAATEIFETKSTLEEYYNAVPVEAVSDK
ncbi:M15 family metallopeptidase [Bacillus sp. SD075]|uniref:M15 family metallopeptidase n=1 Tax=Bacillus sp. SD075 TaxID=2781732 RepID=UPI001A95EEF0|nr:M15 family metallopeptidase [Bacillus sp. SD075]MBO0997779.1 M15 family metallopeptidase [Bacillus sp. SD075]